MFLFLVETAHAMGAPAQQAGAEAPNPILQFVPLILIFVIFYFLLIRPQQKRVKEHKAMLDAIKRGDEVVTNGGLIGRVSSVSDDELSVEIAKDVKIRVRRDAVASINTGSASKEKSE